MENRRIHLVSANAENPFGLEFFVKKSFEQLGYEVICTNYRVMGKYEVDTRIRYITDVDFLLCIKGDRVNPESIFACRVLNKILWMQDSIQINQEAAFVIQTKAWAFSKVYTFDNFEIPLYEQQGIKAKWLPLAAYPELHRKIDIEKQIDISFIGTLTGSRVEMIQFLLDHEVPVNLFYSKDKYAELVNRTKINLNIGIIPYGYQQRIFEILGMGGFLLTNRLKGGNEIFKDKFHLVYYNDFEHLLNLIEYYYNNYDEALKIAECGKKEVLNNHTYINRAKKIIGDINNG